ncbi:LOW QUALITY PROTEIN: phospholipid phosphatase-related protein type 5-like [Acanthochromis polyacanthus]|uniref:LOW QUALITY PROTEIN: phospholipid phosphatase-related protein type 5-like n=1 Tax=Acanthochromis polyacanthus TaxID=80966 RepID=UPI0022344797|nr:LOW QUALITY PROTEIN: phospholipid phosphatase-related protein type 5-like [Acanthochromis polyacanthus]
MLYFQVVILAAAVMLVYYFEFTDTFSPAEQGFICRDPALSRPDPGSEQSSSVQPVILYCVVGGLPVVLISGVEVTIFLLHYNLNNLYDQEKAVVMGDCCYVNPMVRRTFRFLGVYVFGLFMTDIFVNAGQMVTGSLAPYFLSVCRPNYTALDCQNTARFISQSDACTGNPDDIMRARKTFPSKEAALSLYLAVYLAVSYRSIRLPSPLRKTSMLYLDFYCGTTLSCQMYVMSCVGSNGGRLAGPLLSLSLVSVAVLTGINRVAENRNHWRDVIAGQAVGAAIAVFLVVFVVQYFKKRPRLPQSPSDAGTADTDEASPQINHSKDNSDKYAVAQTPGSCTEVT